MKKFLTSILAFVLVFTMSVPVFAATPSDVTDADQQAAVAKLMSLGIVKGYTDGSIKPDQNITRAEFAKVVAYAAGFAKAAEYLGSSSTGFSDVATSHWASGYIAVAASKGYVKGYGDGTFGPSKNITYAEVITVLSRILGYKDAGLVGAWPSNYIIKADEIGLLDDIKFSASVAATRGDVFVVTSTALDQDVVKYDEETDSFDSTGKTLLAKAFEGSLKDAVVVSPELTGKDDNVVELNIDGTEYDKKVADGYVVVGAPSIAALWGHEVQVLFNDDDKVAVIVDNQDAEDVVTGEVETAVTFDVYATEVDLDDMDEIDLASGFYVFNNEVGAVGTTVQVGAQAKLYLDGEGDIRFAQFTTFNPANGLVTDLSDLSSKQVGTISFTKMDTTSGTVKVNEDTKFYLNGEEAEYAELAEDQVLNVVRDNDDANYAASVYAFDKVVEGEVTAVKGTNKVKVDGTYYEVVGSNVDVTTLVLGDEYTFALSSKDEIVADITDNAGNSFVGYLVDVDTYTLVENGRTKGTVADALIVDENGDQRTITLDDDANAGTLDNYEGQLLNFNLNDDGELVTSGADIYTTLTAGYTVTSAAYVEDIDTATKRIGLDTDNDGNVDSTLRYASDVVVFNASDYDLSDPELDDVSVGGLDALSENDEVTVYYENSKLAITYVVISNDGDGGEDQLDAAFGLFVEGFTEIDADDDKHYYITLNVDGEEVTFETESNLASGLTADAPYGLADVDADGVYEVLVSFNGTETVNAVPNTSAKSFTTNTPNSYVVSDNTVIFFEDDGDFYLGTFADIQNGVKVQVVEATDADGVTLTEGGYTEAAVIVVLE